MRRNAWPLPTACDLNLTGNGSTSAVADLTPLLDTVFQIILLLLATLIHSSIVRGFPVNLPLTSEPAGIQKDNDAIEISVDKEGRIYIADRNVSLAEVGPVVQMMTALNPSHRVFVRADTDVPYGSMAQVLCRLSNCLPSTEIVLIIDSADP